MGAHAKLFLLVAPCPRSRKQRTMKGVLLEGNLNCSVNWNSFVSTNIISRTFVVRLWSGLLNRVRWYRLCGFPLDVETSRNMCNVGPKGWSLKLSSSLSTSSYEIKGVSTHYSCFRVTDPGFYNHVYECCRSGDDAPRDMDKWVKRINHASSPAE